MKSLTASDWTRVLSCDTAEKAGLRFGDKGAHTSRTMMLEELSIMMDKLSHNASRREYAAAIIEDNILGKLTAATRRLTNQRLGEIYGLDPRIAIFRVLRRLWEMDIKGRPLLALMCAMGRDPLLRAAAAAVQLLEPGEELSRTSMLRSIREVVGDRLNDDILDKVARNAGSSFTQSGHLEGRTRKIRKKTNSTPYTAAFALWLGFQFGKSGGELLSTPWAGLMDLNGQEMQEIVLKSKQLQLIRANIGGGVTEIDPSGLDSDREVR